MSTLVINSAESLQCALGDLRTLWDKHKFLRVNIKTGKDRSVPQNNFTHAWYEQLARELPQHDALEWKAHCKLHCGVPILRIEDEEFRLAYDGAIRPLDYEKKLAAMKYWPVTSIMTKPQLSKYAEAVQAEFSKQGVMLEFPVPRAA